MATVPVWNQNSTAGNYGATQSPYAFRTPPQLPGMNSGQRYQLDLMGDLSRSYQQAYDAANRANEQRYQDILGGYRDRYATTMGMLDGLGQQGKADIQQRYRSAENQGVQDLTSRGLTGTTILPTMRAGYSQRMEADLGRYDDALRQQRLGMQAGLTGDVLNFMERRNDQGPDLGQLAALSQQVGQLAAMSQRPTEQPRTVSGYVNRPTQTPFSMAASGLGGFGGRIAPTSNLFRSAASMF